MQLFSYVNLVVINKIYSPDHEYQSCYPRGLALASRILEDTSWRSWPWPWHLRPWPWPWEKVLVLALALARPRPRLFLHDPGHMVAVRVCSAHTHSVTWQSAISCLGMFYRLACKL